MNQWTLATRDGFFAINGETMEDEVITGQPLLIDPSITFRKHFEIPGSVDKDPKKLKIELFSRFLPSDVNEYICQFHDGPVSGEGAKRILGLAIKEKDMQWLEGLHGEDGPKYFLEHLLSPPQSPDPTQALEFPLPNGVYFGVFQGDFLSWARYQSSPKEASLNQTRDYINDEFSTVTEIQALPSFPEQLDHSGEWINTVSSWLPTSPDTDKILTRDTTTNNWEAWRSTAWTLLILLIVAIGVWTYYNYRLLRTQQNWLDQKSATLFEESTDRPVQHLQSNIRNVEKKLRTQAKQVLDVYPRLYQLDQAISRHDVLLLQLQLRKNQGQVVLATDSLQSAESMKETLLNYSNISRVEIVSTNPQQDGDYNYKVNINMKWTAQS